MASKRRRIPTALAIAVVSTLAALGLAEGLVRVFVPQRQTVLLGHIRQTAADKYRVTEPLFANDPELFWQLTPNMSMPTDHWLFPGLVSNPQGLREDHIISVRKPPGQIRILSIGDSTTFGLYVKHTETYTHVAEQILQSRLENPRIEFINAGVPGYTLFQAWRYLVTKGTTLDPDLVLIHCGWNDMASWEHMSDSEHYRQQQAIQPIRGLRWSRLCQLLWSVRPLSTPETDHDQPQPRVRPKEFHDLLVKINEYTTLHDMAMLLLIPGSTRDITINLEKDSRNQMQMEQVRFGHRIDLDPVSPGHIDCVQLLKKMAREHTVTEIFHDNFHPTRLAHQQIGLALADKLEQWIHSRQ